jgi:cellobiose phosphorylase
VASYVPLPASSVIQSALTSANSNVPPSTQVYQAPISQVLQDMGITPNRVRALETTMQSVTASIQVLMQQADDNRRQADKEMQHMRRLMEDIAKGSQPAHDGNQGLPASMPRTTDWLTPRLHTKITNEPASSGVISSNIGVTQDQVSQNQSEVQRQAKEAKFRGKFNGDPESFLPWHRRLMAWIKSFPGLDDQWTVNQIVAHYVTPRVHDAITGDKANTSLKHGLRRCMVDNITLIIIFSNCWISKPSKMNRQ